MKFHSRRANANDTPAIADMLMPHLAAPEHQHHQLKHDLADQFHPNSCKKFYVIIDNYKMVGVYSLQAINGANGTKLAFVSDVGIDGTETQIKVLQLIEKDAKEKAVEANCQQLLVLDENIKKYFVKEVRKTQHPSMFVAKFNREILKANDGSEPLQKLARGMAQSKL